MIVLEREGQEITRDCRNTAKALGPCKTNKIETGASSTDYE